MAKDRKIGKSFPLGTMVCPGGCEFERFRNRLYPAMSKDLEDDWGGRINGQRPTVRTIT